MTVFLVVLVCCAVVWCHTYICPLSLLTVSPGEEHLRTLIPGCIVCEKRGRIVGPSTSLTNSVSERIGRRSDATPHAVCKTDLSTLSNYALVAVVRYGMAEPSEQFSAPELCRVAVRLPPFWTDKPAIWFAQAESQFELAAITR